MKHERNKIDEQKFKRQPLKREDQKIPDFESDPIEQTEKWINKFLPEDLAEKMIETLRSERQDEDDSTPKPDNS